MMIFFLLAALNPGLVAEQNRLMAAVAAAEDLAMVSAELAKLFNNTRGKLWGKFMKIFYSYIPPRINQDLEDAFYGGWERVIVQRKHYNPSKNAYNWMLIVIRNFSKNFLDSYDEKLDEENILEQRKKEILLLNNGDTSMIPKSLMEEDSQQIVGLVELAMQSALTEKESTVFTLRAIECLSYEEIQKKLNMPLSTIHKTYNRACDKLKVVLKAKNISAY